MRINHKISILVIFSWISFPKIAIWLSYLELYYALLQKLEFFQLFKKNKILSIDIGINFPVIFKSSWVTASSKNDYIGLISLLDHLIIFIL